MSADPVDLTVKHVNKSGHYVAPDQCVGNFWITSCSLLNPAAIVSHSYTGAVKVESFRKLRFVLANGCKLTFARHYQHRKNDESEDITFSEQVAEFDFIEKRRKLFKINEALGQFEDVLRLSSFAARYRCACVGWEMTSANQHVRHFRRNVAIPKKAGERRDDELIELVHFSRFIRTAYRRFTTSEFRENLSRAIDYAIPRNDRTLESSFVSLFAALETLISGFRAVRDLQVLLPRREWKRVEGSLKAHLATQSPFKSDATLRQLVFQKLPELNRISLSVAIQRFCRVYRVSLNDLWPLIGNDPGGPSLSSLRNKLVHGKVFRTEHHSALIVAGQHLQWTVERMILAALGWKAIKSRVAPRYLSHFNAYKDWRTLRLSLLK